MLSTLAECVRNDIGEELPDKSVCVFCELLPKADVAVTVWSQSVCEESKRLFISGESV